MLKFKNYLERKLFFNNNILNEVVYNKVMYHGTTLDKVLSILKNGLDASKGTRPSYSIGNYEEGNYLTSDIERAARYASHLGKTNVTSAIFEIIISTPKRIKKMKYDIADRPNEEDTYGSDINVYNEVDFLIKNINNLISNYFNSRNLQIFQNYYVDDFFKLNIYSKILSELRKYKNIDIKKVKKELFPQIKKIFDDSEFFDISNSGTIYLSKEGIETLKQFNYKKKLPPSTIKAVYIPSIYMPKNINRNKISILPNLLPQEPGVFYRAIKNTIDDILFSLYPIKNLDNYPLFKLYNDFSNKKIQEKDFIEKSIDIIDDSLDEIEKYSNFNNIKELLSSKKYKEIFIELENTCKEILNRVKNVLNKIKSNQTDSKAKEIHKEIEGLLYFIDNKIDELREFEELANDIYSNPEQMIDPLEMTRLEFPKDKDIIEKIIRENI